MRQFASMPVDSDWHIEKGGTRQSPTDTVIQLILLCFGQASRENSKKKGKLF
jgi:hypothetical protein